ncbi:hypothetical protein DdX_08603 [Ditylenchus destructor]|uniref:Uncharacterized protein n=1 Tax=Ditylenchus destructor TaxID=166010 RepID=A0AAD4N1F1_9BILA|nr:hypothetical protein DdX_08603 [Ditylenchus destructor]
MAKPGPVEVSEKTFIVLFSRASTRKHKTWDFDGRLHYRYEEYFNGGVSELTLNKELKNGKTSEVFKNKGSHIKRIVEAFEPGHEFLMSNWDIQIQEEVGQNETTPASSCESAVDVKDTKVGDKQNESTRGSVHYDRFGFSRPTLSTNNEENDCQKFLPHLNNRKGYSRIEDEAAVRRLPIFNTITELPVDLGSSNVQHLHEKETDGPGSQGSQHSQPLAKKLRTDDQLNLSAKDVNSSQKLSQKSTSYSQTCSTQSRAVDDDNKIINEDENEKESVDDEDYFPATPEE